MDGARLVRYFSGLVTLWLVVITVHAVQLPQNGEDIHMGVASCASSVCHGSIAPKSDTQVLLNEYRTWSLHDRHARAYKTLLTNESKQIARKLGLPNAHQADICLDCHSDNIQQGKRGRRFQLSDGVGCEACHGGAERWIKSHTEAGASHNDNLAKGMYPTEDPALRAQLCLSCHLGTTEKLATHKIMGAGHPRLSFELDTFTVLQPEHYVKDADYARRKPDITSPQIWATGQIAGARRFLELLVSRRFHSGGMFPEISFFDCHACHHPMNEIRWQKQGAGHPGDIRLNDAYLQMTGVILAELLPEQQKQWLDQTTQLQIASQKNVADVVNSANALLAQVPDITQRFKRPQSEAQQKALVRRILRNVAAGNFNDYTSGEQAVMACSVLISSLKLDKPLGGVLDALYDALGNEHRYDPDKLKKAASKAIGSVETLL